MSSDPGRRSIAPFGRRRATVAKSEAVGAYRLLRCSDPEGPEPRPGQFYMVAAVERWGGGEDERPYLPRALSFLRSRAESLEFLLEDVGPGTRRLGELTAGEELWLTGPLGAGFTAPHEGRRAVLAGGGIGIVPLAGWQDGLSAREIPVEALLGFRDADHAQAAGLLAVPEVATDDGSVGRRGFVTELLAAALHRDAHAEVYACGPPPMLEAVRALAAERGVPAQLALEAGMACGFGACFGCVVPTRAGYQRVCVEGPVFEAAHLSTALAAGAGQ